MEEGLDLGKKSYVRNTKNKKNLLIIQQNHAAITLDYDFFFKYILERCGVCTANFIGHFVVCKVEFFRN